MSVILGEDTKTGVLIEISDIDRFGGLYVLGKTGTGKSNLLISLALQDIEQSHGLLFIDPHSDAINALLERVPEKRINDVILLDPTDRDYAFGINPVYCKDPNDIHERESAFGQTRDIFAKLTMLFGESDERLKVLLSKYLRNILYPLIENPGSTLYDISMMLTNKPFREHLLKNVKHNLDTVDFWHKQFDPLSKHDQYEELKSTFNRISIFERPYIRDIISQPQPTIDFTKIMEDRKIVLLRLPMSPSDDETRSFIGTLVISQLLKVIFLRTDIAESQRVPFAIYCDELHNFATPDFAKLFSQARKFKIMPVVAHQERGQFKPADPNKSATLASPNKVHFSLSTPDAEEFAKEIADKPPVDIRLEPQKAISQSPVSDLLRGHTNPEIQKFVDTYLRPMQNRIDNIKDEIESKKLVRTGMMDESAISRLNVQMLGVDRFEKDTFLIQKAIEKEMELAERSYNEANALKQLQAQEVRLKQDMHSLDRLLTMVMEQRITPKNKELADFLINNIENATVITQEQKQALKQFIAAQYNETSAKETREKYISSFLRISENKLNALQWIVFINEFTHFCELLGKPENHIKKPTGQDIIKEIPLRTEADMVGEMRRELTTLPNFIAYVKIQQNKYKIITLMLREKLPDSVCIQNQQEILNQTYKYYCSLRNVVEKGIREKQSVWQKDTGDKPPPTGRNHRRAR